VPAHLVKAPDRVDRSAQDSRPHLEQTGRQTAPSGEHQDIQGTEPARGFRGSGADAANAIRPAEVVGFTLVEPFPKKLRFTTPDGLEDSILTLMKTVHDLKRIRALAKPIITVRDQPRVVIDMSRRPPHLDPFDLLDVPRPKWSLGSLAD